MKKLSKWLKNQSAAVSLALAGVEKNALGQKGDTLEQTIAQERRHTQGTLADSLKQGQVTQEVMDLRWRTYKILNAVENYKAEIVGYEKHIDENGKEIILPITKVTKVDKKRGLTKIKIDGFDDFPLEMVVDNTEITLDGNEAMKDVKAFDSAVINKNEKGEIESATHGEVKAEEYFAKLKGESPIKITRSALPKFELERFTKKMCVRKISENERLLEFYVSMYPDEFNRTTRLFISDVKKAIVNPRQADFLDFDGIEFISYKTIGVDDFLHYSYTNIKFDKIVEYNGHYVIKFKADISINAHNIFEQYKQDELEEKYEKKERKKT
jgi:hypothetical protein